jgi:hypothetical protein
MQRPTGRLRIVRGSVRDLIFDRSGRCKGSCVREGWWWVCVDKRPDGLPCDPEGVFATKESARRHLAATLAQRESRVGGIRWGRNWHDRKRATMRPIPCNRATPAQIRKELNEWRR